MKAGPKVGRQHQLAFAGEASRAAQRPQRNQL
jgi:hypothetical protein